MDKLISLVKKSDWQSVPHCIINNPPDMNLEYSPLSDMTIFRRAIFQFKQLTHKLLKFNSLVTPSADGSLRHMLKHNTAFISH